MTSPAPIARAFAFEGAEYRMTIDFETIAAFEEATGVSIIDVAAPPGGGSPLISRLARLLMFGLQRHHPEADLNLAGRMMADPAVRDAFTAGLGAALPQDGDVPGDEGNAPAGASRQSRRAVKSRSAGRTGSSSRAKRG